MIDENEILDGVLRRWCINTSHTSTVSSAEQGHPGRMAQQQVRHLFAVALAS